MTERMIYAHTEYAPKKSGGEAMTTREPRTVKGRGLFTNMEPMDMYESNGVMPDDIIAVEEEMRGMVNAEWKAGENKVWHYEGACAPPPAEAVEALRALVDAVDEQLRPAQAGGGWGDSPLSRAVDEARRILDAATLERAIYNAGLQLVEAGKYNVAPAVGSILRVRAEYARLAEQPKEPAE